MTTVPVPHALVVTHWAGVERDELLRPVADLTAREIRVSIASPRGRVVQTVVDDVERAERVDADLDLDSLDPNAYDIAIFPGGVVNADRLRLNRTAVGIITEFAAAGKPVAMICHSPWLLIETDLLPGKTVTSFPSLRSDLLNAGADWVDQPVVSSDTDAWRLITSRRPIDLRAFADEIAGTLLGRP
ncbi:DJ-1/PfpI family protein [Williamsia sterculiae]|uniref:DJ-1/PfpI family protein n=1 Tax=Williamsia sterculiae TaxID=1344003 RepID=UPI002E123647